MNIERPRIYLYDLLFSFNNLELSPFNLLLVDRVLQATMQFGGEMAEAQSEADLAILHRVKKTASQSLKLNHRLKGVKERVYELQEDMRHL